MRPFKILLLALCFAACSPEQPFPPVPLDAYVLPGDFRLEVVAAEPLIDTPVAMCFDASGRIWVAEMRGYMTDLDNSGEKQPNGRIVILDDRNGDGIMDTRRVFLDSLVLPRALALVYGGLLYAEPPNLWFVEIQNDRPGARTLVDSSYAAGGNVEHQPNGLLPGLDNWIYSAKSALRYRRKNGRWLREKTHFRGQWGITQDAAGRLFYNDNSNQLQGDWVLPNALLRNRYFSPSAGFNIQVCTDQRVFPLQPTAVNRGYQEDMLDSSGRLRNVTSACGPLVYRGGQFPAEYAGNAFVCAPEANLVKRNVFDPGEPKLKARQAYPDRDFLAAYDKGFRPVNLNEGPDGCLYVTDMHRGIIQHKTYLTAYLRERIQSEKLDTITGRGRILRVLHAGRPRTPAPPLASASLTELVDALDHPNPWVCDQARQLLIERGGRDAEPLLQRKLLQRSDPKLQLQVLWTLEGLDALDAPLLIQMLHSAKDPWVLQSALQLLETFAGPEQTGPVCKALDSLYARRDPVVDLALCLYAGPWSRTAPERVDPLLLQLLGRYPQDTLYQEAMVSGLSEREADFLALLQKTTPQHELPYLKQILARCAAGRRENRPAAWTLEPQPGRDGLTAGLQLYTTLCGACHGPTGQGTPNLAPPLDGSEFVHGNPDKLALIALHGLQGPLHIKGQLYTFNAGMPGLGPNPECTDTDLAAVLTFVRNAFSREPYNFSAKKIDSLRLAPPAAAGGFTAGELLERIRD